MVYQRKDSTKAELHRFELKVLQLLCSQLENSFLYRHNPSWSGNTNCLESLVLYVQHLTSNKQDNKKCFYKGIKFMFSVHFIVMDAHWTFGEHERSKHKTIQCNKKIMVL